MLEKSKIIKDLGVIYPTSTSQKRSYCYMCECSKCKHHFVIRKVNHERRKTSLCHECSKHKSKNKKHGFYSHKLYGTWSKEKERCYNPKTTNYSKYGERGIKVSDEFLDFKTWLDYVESLPNAYKEKHTIDRINNDGNYERGNLRWASQSVQARNTRRIMKTNTSGFRGVALRKDDKKWRSSVTVGCKKINLGTFNCKYQAGYTRDKYIRDNKLEHTVNFEPQNYILTPANLL